MIKEGSSAPSFTLPGTDGENIKEYTLGDYTERGVVVIAFYPFDFSPICTEELCNFSDSGLLTFTEEVDVFGISTDSVYAHQEFSKQNDLMFPLLSDTDGAVTNAYDALYDEWEGHPEVAKRAVITIDASNTVRHVWSTEDAYENPDLHDIFEEVKDVLRKQGEWSDNPTKRD